MMGGSLNTSTHEHGARKLRFTPNFIPGYDWRHKGNLWHQPVIHKSSSIDGFWPGRADDDARLLAKKRSFADVSDEKLRGHRHRPVMAAWVRSPAAAL